MKNNILHPSGSYFLVQQLGDQLCRMEPRHQLFILFLPYIWTQIEIKTVCIIVIMKKYGMDWEKCLKCQSPPEHLLQRWWLPSPLVLYLTSAPYHQWWKENRVHLNISCRGDGCHLPRSFTWHQPVSSVMVEMCWFHLSMFHWTKLKLQHRLFGDSSLSLASIQPSTVHGCFSSAAVSCFSLL